jgi:hypothetical protein
MMAQAPQNASFEEGKRLYFDLEFELAVFRFREAAKAPELAPPDRASVYAWLGLSYAQIAETNAAKEAFIEAAKLDANVVLPSEANPPPKASELLAEAKKEVANAPPPTPTPAPTPPPTTDATPAPAAPPATASEGGPLGMILLASGGGVAVLGLAGVGAGAVFGVIASDLAAQGNAADFQDDAKAFADQAEQNALLANVAFAVGGVLVAAGAAVAVGSFLVE